MGSPLHSTFLVPPRQEDVSFPLHRCASLPLSSSMLKVRAATESPAGTPSMHAARVGPSSRCTSRVGRMSLVRMSWRVAGRAEGSTASWQLRIGGRGASWEGVPRSLPFTCWVPQRPPPHATPPTRT